MHVCVLHFFVVVKINLKVNGKSEDNHRKPDQLSLDVKNLNLQEVSDEVNVRSYRAQTFTFDELAAATRKFRSDCFLGEGGFGKVYKGCIEKINQVLRYQNQYLVLHIYMTSLYFHSICIEFFILSFCRAFKIYTF